MTEPRQVDLWPCGYVAKCSAPTVPPTRQYHPALSRQPGATRSPDRGLRYTHEGADRGAESDRSQALISINSLLWSPRGDRKSVVKGKRVDLGGRRIIKK